MNPIASKIILAIFFMSSIHAIGQHYEVTYSDRVKLYKEHLFTHGFIGEDQENIYVLLKNKDNRLEECKKIYVQAIEKSIMIPGPFIKLFDSRDYKTKSRVKYVYKSKGGFVAFFETTRGNEREVFAQSFDSNLNVVQDHMKIYDYNSREGEMKLMQHPESDNFVLIAQKYVEKDEQIKVEYISFDQGLNQLYAGVIETEVYSSMSLRRSWLRSNTVLKDFHLSESDDLISFIRVSNDAHADKIELSFIDIKSGVTDRQWVALGEDKYFGEYTILLEDGKVIITGFYANAIELDRRYSSQSITVSKFNFNGTFFKRFDIATRKMIASTIIKFDEDLMKKVEMTNPANYRRIKSLNGSGLDMETRGVSGHFVIRKVTYGMENKDATIYCEYLHNYMESNSPGEYGGLGSKKYNSIRGSLFMFNISLNNGQMNWYTTLRKLSNFASGKYKIYHIKTLEVIPSEKGDLVLFHSYKVFNENDSSDIKGEKVKTKMLDQDYFAARINRKDGSYQIYKPGEVGTKLPEYQKIQIETVHLSDKGNQIYTINEGLKIRPGYIPLYLLWGAFRMAGLQLKKESYTVSRIDAN